MDLREGRGQCEWVHYQHYNSAGQSQGKNDNIGRRGGVTEKGSNDGREGRRETTKTRVIKCRT